MNFGGDLHCPPYIFCLLFKKTEKVHVHLYLNQILHYFHLKKEFPRMNNKKITKRGPQGAILLFLHEVSMVVLIDFIPILPTPGIPILPTPNSRHSNTPNSRHLFNANS